MATLDFLRSSAQGGVPSALFDTLFIYPTPHINDVRNDAVRAVVSYGQVIASTPSASAEVRQNAIAVIDRSIVEIEKNTSLHPKDIRLYLLLSDIYKVREGILRDGSSVPKIFSSIETARSLSPKRQQTLYMLSSLYQSVGDVARAESLLRQAIDLDKQVIYGWSQLLSLYVGTNNTEKAEKLIPELEQYNVAIPREVRKLLNQDDSIE
jgi:tetratricopeptide (TPR) repeat protein